MLTKQLRRLTPVGLLVSSGTLLSGCATDGVGFSTFTGKAGGVCDAFERPAYQVLGKTPYDQAWVDKVTEAGVAGCKWERPGARPVELDAAAPAPMPKANPAKKPSIWSHVRSKLGK